jgi:hypothetical protein
MTTLDEARRFLLNLLPPGAERPYSLIPGGDVYQLFDAFAASVKQFGFDLLDVLRLEITPAECIQKLAGPLVKSVIAPLLGFLNPATLQILNTDRVAMRASIRTRGATPGVG